MSHGNSGPAAVIFWFVLLDFAIQWTACLFSAVYQTELFFDLTGSCTFLLGAFLSLAIGGSLHQRQVVASSLVSIWAVRLGTFLFTRILRRGKDSRFDGVRDQPIYLMMFWTVQGMWVLLVSLPLLILNASHPQPQWLSATDVAGMAIWLTGFLIETISDHQKLLFSLRQENEGRWISSGLWSWSQHPNYFGEILLWFGLYLLAFAGLSPAYRLICLVSPLFTLYALVRMSGIPLLDKASQHRWGKDAAQLYGSSNHVMLMGGGGTEQQQATLG
ncbi:unnamed protein product [Closterium sp. Naga37s-1]|nr:unnamed protein product [Closterium sp. Naga37s-1]